MPTVTPSLSWLVNWALPDFEGSTATACKNAMLDAARAWYQTAHPSDYPNSIDAMLYAYLLDLYHGGGGTYAELVLADGATHYWPLDDSGAVAADAIGTLHGAIVGPVLLNQPGVVPPTTCMEFPNDGTGLITLPSFPSLAVAFTLEMWVRLSVYASVTAGLAMRQVLTDGDFSLLVSTSFFLRFSLFSGAPQAWTSSDGVPVNTWLYLAAVGGAGQFTMYVNGAVAAPGSQAMTLVGDGAGPMALAGSTEAAWGWRGDMQDVAFYPLALTPAQIAAHYAARL